MCGDQTCITFFRSGVSSACACADTETIALMELSILFFQSLNASSAQRDIVLERDGMILDSMVLPKVLCILYNKKKQTSFERCLNDLFRSLRNILSLKNPQHTKMKTITIIINNIYCLLYTSPSPRDATLSRMPSSA